MLRRKIWIPIRECAPRAVLAWRWRSIEPGKFFTQPVIAGAFCCRPARYPSMLSGGVCAFADWLANVMSNGEGVIDGEPEGRNAGSAYNIEACTARDM